MGYIEDTEKVIGPLGWKHRGAFWWYYPYQTECNQFSSRDLSWRLNITDEEGYIRVEVYERNSFEWETALTIPYNIEALGYFMKVWNIAPTEFIQVKEDEIFKK